MVWPFAVIEVSLKGAGEWLQLQYALTMLEFGFGEWGL
jgi:hypothetical protein